MGAPRKWQAFARDNVFSGLRFFAAGSGIEAFSAVVVVEAVAEGIASLIQCEGLSAPRPSTLLLRWPTALLAFA